VNRRSGHNRSTDQRKIGWQKRRPGTILKIFKTHNENARKLIGIDFAKETVIR